MGGLGQSRRLQTLCYSVSYRDQHNFSDPSSTLLTTHNGEYFILAVPPCHRFVVRFAPRGSITDEFDDGWNDCGWMSLIISL